MARTEIGGDQIKDGTIFNADINSAAAIAGTKINPNFGTQNLIVDSNLLYVDAAALKVGIGVAPTLAKLEVNGDLRLDGRVTAGLKMDMFGSADFLIRETSTADVMGFGTVASPNILSVNISNGRIGVGTVAGANALSVVGSADLTGSLGVGVSTPGGKLDVAGNIVLSATASFAANPGFPVIYSDSGSGLRLQAFAGGSSQFNLVNASGSEFGIDWLLSGSLQLVPQAGNVGIGMGATAPADKLTVNGDIRIIGSADGGNVPDSALLFGAGSKAANFLSASGATVEVNGSIGGWNTTYNVQNSKVEFYQDAANTGELRLYTNAGSGITERLRITNSGQVNMFEVLNLSGVNKIHLLSGHNFLQGDATRTYLYGGTDGGQIRKSDNSIALMSWTDLGAVDIIGGLAFSGTAGTDQRITMGSVNTIERLGTGRLNIATNAADITLNPAAGVAVGAGSAHASALFQIDSTTKGFLAPRMTEAQRDSIGTPATGLLIFQTDNTPGYRYYDGDSWETIGGGSAGHVIQDEGTPLTARPNMNFVGAGVSVTDDAGNSATKVEIGGGVETRQSFVATGGQTVFTLSTPYTLGGLNLQVYRNGALQKPGSGNDYVETNTTTITFENAQTAGDLIECVYRSLTTSILTTSPGTEYRQAFTATGGAQTFTLSNPYVNSGTNLKVYVNGGLQKPVTNYSEDNTTQFTFSTGLTAGDNVEAFWTSAATGVVSYTPATEIRQNFVATGSEAGLFALTGGATFTQGGANLKVYVDGVLNRLGGANDYTEPSNSQVQFNAGNHPTAGQVVDLVAITQTGALGNFQNRRDEFVATASQTVFSASFTFVMGGADMLVYNDGVLMKLGEDYYELNNTQVVFYTGRTLNSKVTLVGKIQAAAGDANSVNGISASITPTANKLVPLDGSGLLPVSTIPGPAIVSTQSVTGVSSVTFSGLVPDAHYQLRFRYTQGTLATIPRIVINGDLGANYRYGLRNIGSNTDNGEATSEGDTLMKVGTYAVNISHWGMGELLFTTQPGTSSKVQVIVSAYYDTTGGTSIQTRGGGKYTGASPLSSFQFGVGSGTMTGTFTLMKVS